MRVRGSPALAYTRLVDGGAYVTLDAGDPAMGLTNARNQAKYAKVDVLSECGDALDPTA